MQVHTYASRFGLGAVLLEEDEERRYRSVLYLRRPYKGTELIYSSTEMEALVVKPAFRRVATVPDRPKLLATTMHSVGFYATKKETNVSFAGL